MTNFKVGNIVQLAINDVNVQQTQKMLDFIKTFDDVTTPIPRENLHITLLKLSRDQRLLFQKKWPIIPTTIPMISLKEEAYMIIRPSDGSDLNSKARRAWIMLVNEQAELRKLVDEFVESNDIVISDYEKRRPFHVSIANTTGSPFDSVGDVEWNDIEVK